MIVKIGGRSADDLNLPDFHRPLPITPAAKLSAGMKTATSLSPDKLLLKYEKFTFRQLDPAAIYRVLATVRLQAAAGTPDAPPPPASRLQREGEAAARAVTG